MTESTKAGAPLPQEESPNSRQLLSNLTAGAIIGLLQVFMALSFAALIFTGALSDFVYQGIGLALVGMVIIGLIIATFTSLPGAVGGSQGVPAAITSLMAAAIAAEVSSGGSPSEIFATVMVAIALTGVTTGLIFWGLGRFRLGGLVRFLPYPVVGGFLAGTGWLLLIGAIEMMLDLPVAPDGFSALVQPEVLAYWIPGLALALTMLLMTRRYDHFLLLPGMLVGAVALFFVIARLAGYSLADLSDQGWLLGPFPEGDGFSWRPFNPVTLAMVDWPAISAQAGNIVAIVTVSAISLLLNAGGLELATNRDVEANRELQVAGIANLVAGLAAGLVGYKQLSLSTLNFKLGGNSRLPGLVAAGICALVLMADASVLAALPRVVIGSLLLLLGLDFLYDWVIAGWRRLPKIDYAIVVVILLVTAAVGFLEAVALGLLLATVLFVVSYIRNDVLRHELSGESYQSRVSRSRGHSRHLAQKGDRLHILKLQGFIFFGTANNLLNQVRARISDPSKEKPDFAVLDFRQVTGLDSTAMLSFARLKQLAENERITLVFTQPNERVLRQLRQGGLDDDGRTVRIFHSLDEGVEACENQLLAGAGMESGGMPSSLADQLREILASESGILESNPQVQALLDAMKQLNVETGQLLLALGDDPDSLYFVETGRVTAQLPRDGRPPVRLQTSGSGSVVGEIGFYLGQKRTADVIADTPGLLYEMTIDGLQQLEANNPEAASVLHQIMIQLLAERVVHLTNTIRALER